MAGVDFELKERKSSIGMNRSVHISQSYCGRFSAYLWGFLIHMETSYCNEQATPLPSHAAADYAEPLLLILAFEVESKV